MGNGGVLTSPSKIRDFCHLSLKGEARGAVLTWLSPWERWHGRTVTERANYGRRNASHTAQKHVFDVGDGFPIPLVRCGGLRTVREAGPYKAVGIMTRRSLHFVGSDAHIRPLAGFWGRWVLTSPPLRGT